MRPSEPPHKRLGCFVGAVRDQGPAAARSGPLVYSPLGAFWSEPAPSGCLLLALPWARLACPLAYVPLPAWDMPLASLPLARLDLPFSFSSFSLALASFS